MKRSVHFDLGLVLLILELAPDRNRPSDVFPLHDCQGSIPRDVSHHDGLLHGVSFLGRTVETVDDGGGGQCVVEELTCALFLV